MYETVEVVPGGHEMVAFLIYQHGRDLVHEVRIVIVMRVLLLVLPGKLLAARPSDDH